MRNNGIFFGLAMLVLTAPFPVYAARVGRFHVEINSPHAGPGLEEAKRLLDGWTCAATGRVIHSRYVADHHAKRQEWVSVSDSILPQSVWTADRMSFDFDRELGSFGSQLKVKLLETCELKPSQEISCKAGGSGPAAAYTCVKSGSHSIVTAWACDFKSSPSRPGQKIVSGCEGSIDGGMDGALPPGARDRLLKAAQTRVLQAEVSFLSEQEKITRDGCAGSSNGRTIIYLSQGVGGHIGEDDFEFMVKIGSMTPFKVRSSSGLLDESIAYCGGEDQIPVTVSAVERDLFQDDDYGSSSVMLSRRASGEVTFLTLHRSSITGLTDWSHRIRLEVLGSSVGRSQAQ